MLDVHAVTGAGNVALTTLSSIPTSDGASTAGVPVGSKATLVSWGALVENAADGINQIALQDADLIDPQNKIVITPPAMTVFGMSFYENIPYVKGARNIQVKNAVAGPSFGFTIDHYPSGNVKVTPGSYAPSGKGVYPQALSALSSQVYGSATLNPTTNIPNGKWSILGATVSALSNVALLRFHHTDFGGFIPGFPVVNSGAVGTGVVGHILTSARAQGFQFVAIGGMLGMPECPVFSVGPQGSGLTVEILDNNDDTPTVNVVLQYLGA